MILYIPVSLNLNTNLRYNNIFNNLKMLWSTYLFQKLLIYIVIKSIKFTTLKDVIKLFR